MGFSEKNKSIQIIYVSFAFKRPAHSHISIPLSPNDTFLYALARFGFVGGHVAAVRKRSRKWCLTLTPQNTKTIERMTQHGSCDPLGETVRAGPILPRVGFDEKAVHCSDFVCHVRPIILLK